jgi:phosphate-selective porin OprO/OprP
MKPNQLLLLTVAINTILGLTPFEIAQAARKDAKDIKIAQLEQRLLALEKRLEKERDAPVSPALPKTTAAAVENLDNKIKILERKNEVAAENASEAAQKAPKLEFDSKGLVFSSADGDNSVRLRGSIQGDGRFFTRNGFGNSSNGVVNRFELKQARIWLEGRFAKYFDYKLMPDFGMGSITLADAYIDAHYHPALALTVGKQKTPLSLERLQGDSDGAFLERAYPTYLASNRDNGVKLHGSFATPGKTTQYINAIDFKSFFTYEIGLFNGGGDNGASNTDKENENNKEVVGRLWVHPFQDSGIDSLEGLGIGFAGSYEVAKSNSTTLKNLNSAIGQNILLDYTKTGTGVTKVLATGQHYRLYPQAYWYYGPFGLLGEYVLSSQRLTDDQNRVAIQQNNTAWQVQASYVLTGENNTFQSVTPRESFDPFNNRWGALQLAARYSELNIDNKSFKIQTVKGTKIQLLNPNSSISAARAWAIGANWFLNKNTRLMADYEHTDYIGGAANGATRPAENVFATRLQLAF